MAVAPAPLGRRAPAATAAASAAPSRCLGAAATRPPAALRRCLKQQQRCLFLSTRASPEVGIAASTVAALPEEPAAELSPEGQQQWAAARELLLERCGLEGEAADAALLKAFGWKGQGFWRQVGRHLGRAQPLPGTPAL